MGVVFSPEAVASGNVPELGSQAVASDFVLDRLFNETATAEGLLAGMTYGSTTNESVGRRSDLDILIVYSAPFAAQSLDKCRRVFKSATDLFVVPIEPHISPIYAGSTGRADHQLDYTFHSHFQDVARKDDGRWTRNDPLSYLEMPVYSPGEIVAVTQGFVGNKVYKFAKSATDEKRENKNIQRGLELPSSLARRVFDVVALTDDPVEFDRADRKSLSALSGEYLNAYDLDTEDGAQSHRALVDLDKEYSEILENTLNGDLPLSYYSAWLYSEYFNIQLHAVRLASAWQRVINDLANNFKSDKG